jgi:hypothetical protein
MNWHYIAIISDEVIIGVFVGFHAYVNEMHGTRSKIPLAIGDIE